MSLNRLDLYGLDAYKFRGDYDACPPGSEYDADDEPEPEPEEVPVFKARYAAAYTEAEDEGGFCAVVEGVRHRGVPEARVYWSFYGLTSLDEATDAARLLDALVTEWLTLSPSAVCAAMARQSRWHEAHASVVVAAPAAARSHRIDAERWEVRAVPVLSQATECSVCRGVHGLEVVHACE